MSDPFDSHLAQALMESLAQLRKGAARGCECGIAEHLRRPEPDKARETGRSTPKSVRAHAPRRSLRQSLVQTLADYLAVHHAADSDWGLWRAGLLQMPVAAIS